MKKDIIVNNINYFSKEVCKIYTGSSEIKRIFTM